MQRPLLQVVLALGRVQLVRQLPQFCGSLDKSTCRRGQWYLEQQQQQQQQALL
jgi:hypothetical protein